MAEVDWLTAVCPFRLVTKIKNRMFSVFVDSPAQSFNTHRQIFWLIVVSAAEAVGDVGCSTGWTRSTAVSQSFPLKRSLNLSGKLGETHESAMLVFAS
ncbi:MAG: hypothetical protein JJD98_09980 [Polaromonas sp.]|nr:hypothetical protein [Polaromonas sp.]